MTDPLIFHSILILDKLQEFNTTMKIVQLMDKNATQIRYSTRIRFYELFKKCPDDESRAQLFNRLNQNVLKGK